MKILLSPMRIRIARDVYSLAYPGKSTILCKCLEFLVLFAGTANPAPAMVETLGRVQSAVKALMQTFGNCAMPSPEYMLKRNIARMVLIVAFPMNAESTANFAELYREISPAVEQARERLRADALRGLPYANKINKQLTELAV